jgi:cation diffusion facilitator family transporter
VVAFAANGLVAIAKSAAATLTGSASLAAEAVHSWVDTGNECFVLLAARSARRPADEDHPLGYGRESYVWSLFASLGMFALGSVMTIWRGVAQLGMRDEALTNDVVGFAVIGISFLLEGYALVQTVRELRPKAARRRRELFDYVLLTSDAPLRTVFVEDFTALIALFIAAAGMTLRKLTGHFAYDAAGAILIGIMMGAAALMLMHTNRELLGGKALPADLRAEALRLLESFPEVARVTRLYGEFIGPNRLILVAGVIIAGERTQSELASVLRALEQRIRQHDSIGAVILTLANPAEAPTGQ